MRVVCCKISYSVMLVATLLLMGVRLIPHHHCECIPDTIAHTRPIHFGLEDCDDCQNHGCSDRHGHSGKICHDASLFYNRVADDITFVAKKALQLPLYGDISVSSGISDMPVVRFEWYDIHAFKYYERYFSLHALRGPPAA